MRLGFPGKAQPAEFIGRRTKLITIKHLPLSPIPDNYTGLGMVPYIGIQETSTGYTHGIAEDILFPRKANYNEWVAIGLIYVAVDPSVAGYEHVAEAKGFSCWIRPSRLFLETVKGVPERPARPASKAKPGYLIHIRTSTKGKVEVWYESTDAKVAYLLGHLAERETRQFLALRTRAQKAGR